MILNPNILRHLIQGILYHALLCADIDSPGSKLLKSDDTGDQPWARYLHKKYVFLKLNSYHQSLYNVSILCRWPAVDTATAEGALTLAKTRMKRWVKQRSILLWRSPPTTSTISIILITSSVIWYMTWCLYVVILQPKYQQVPNQSTEPSRTDEVDFFVVN